MLLVNEKPEIDLDEENTNDSIFSIEEHNGVNSESLNTYF